MNYIFEDGLTVGKLPIKDIRVAFYNMTDGGYCFDEHFVKPQDFDCYDLMYVCNEDDEDDFDKSRVFVNLLDGRSYEILLKRV